MRKYSVLLVLSIFVFLFFGCKKEEGLPSLPESGDSQEYSSNQLEATNEEVAQGDPTTIDEEAAAQEAAEATAEEAEITSEAETSEAEEEYQDYIDIELTDAEGNAMMLSDYEGKFIALNIFGTWCTYCMKEMPDLQAVYDDYEGDDFVILLANATSTEKNEEDVVDWYTNSGYTMPMGMDIKGELMATYPVQGFPTTVFINKEGKIIGAVSGMLDQDTLYYILETYNK